MSSRINQSLSLLLYEIMEAASFITGEAGATSFGYSVAVGDVNGDSYADVAAGARNYSSGTGRAYTFHSSGSAGVAVSGAGSASSTLTGEAAGSQFGASLVGGY